MYLDTRNIVVHNALGGLGIFDRPHLTYAQKMTQYTPFFIFRKKNKFGI